LIHEWVLVAWHLKGAPELDVWLKYTQRRRRIIIEAVKLRIEAHNEQFDD
jgi:hypothetical protein